MTSALLARLQYGRTEIDYHVRRSRRQKTVGIAVDPRLGVVVTAPHETPADRLEGIVRRKAAWVVQRLRAVGRLEGPLPEREFVSGESYLYLGRHYRLKVLVGAPEVRLAGGWLRVSTKARARAGRAAEIRRLLTDWYRTHAQARFAERVRLLAPRVGVAPPKVLVREQAKRWGSCDAQGNVRLNWRIIQASMRLVDYVIAHELVHLHEKNHTRAFWAALGRAIPDYDRRREELTRVGPRLVW